MCEVERNETLELRLIDLVINLPYTIHGAWMTGKRFICGNLEYVPEGVDVDNFMVTARRPKSQEDDKLGLIFQRHGGASPDVPHQIVLRWMQQKRFTSETSSATNIDTSLWHTVEEHCIETNGHIIGIKLSPDHQYLYVNCRPWKEALDMEKVGTSFHDSPPDISEEMTLTCYSLATYEKINVHVGHQAFTASEACFYIFLSVADNLVAR